MKLLHVITTMDPLSGGPCQGIRNSDSELRKNNGVIREVVSLDDPEADFLGKDEFLIHALGEGKGPWRYNTRLYPWLMENIPRFEVIVINGLWLYSTYATWKAMRDLAILANKNNQPVKLPKMFVMPHGMLDPYFQRAPERRLKALRNWFYWHVIESRVINDAYGLLFTCEIELQLARETFTNYHPKKEINVSYGIINPPPYLQSMELAFRERVKSLANEAYWLFISRVNEKKGVDLLIKAYSRLLDASAGTKKVIPKLVIAGPGLETSFGRKMRQLVWDKKELQKSVFFTGMLAGDAKWGAFYGSEAFILPSHQENFGIAVAEALACGKPVLISDQINIWREIEHENGGIVAKDTLEGVSWMLNKWIDMSKIEKRKMAGNALKTFKKNFAIEPASNRFLEALNS